MNLSISDMSVKLENQVKYLGLIIVSNLNWKAHINELSKKTSKGIGVLSKIRYYVNNSILQQFNSLIYPFQTYVLSLSGAIPIVLPLGIY